MTEQELKAELEKDYSDVMNTAEMTAKYKVLSFSAPFVSVIREEDNVRGSLEFTHMPRFYFNFVQA